MNADLLSGLAFIGGVLMVGAFVIVGCVAFAAVCLLLDEDAHAMPTFTVEEDA